MRIPLTPDGRREIVIATVVLGGLAVGLGYLYWPLALLPAVVWIWAITFFRDPERPVPEDPNLLVAPADGKVTEIVDLEHDDDIGGPARRISIFLSIFNVHINRSPCAGTVRSITYRQGRFVNAMRADSGHLNEANTLVFDGEDGAPSTFVVKQIAGAIARRIVCHAGVGDRLETGQRFGMIKFGSRTELVIPQRAEDEIVVHLGQTVYAGKTILVRSSDDNPSEEA